MKLSIGWNKKKLKTKTKQECVIQPEILQNLQYFTCIIYIFQSIVGDTDPLSA